MEFSYIGKNYKRVDSFEKVTGNAVFTDDMKFPGMLFAKVLRSPIAHGKILEIDISNALKIKGVVKIVTGKDLDVKRVGACIQDQYPIAKDKVRYAGEPVACVIATSKYAAEEAVKEIKVEYEEFPFVIYPQEAIKENSPIIHENVFEYERAGFIKPEGKNCFHHFKIRRGNIENTFKNAYKIITGEYWVPYVHHVQLEPHCAIALYGYDNTFTIYTSSQAPFVVQNIVSKIHSLPLSNVRVIVPYVGGGFGGKSDVTIEPLVSFLAKMVPGRYVKLSLTREEMFEGTNVGRGVFAKYETAVSQEGKILGLKAQILLGAGGYADYAVNIVNGIGMSATGPYEIDNLQIDVYGVYTNTPPTGAFRGYGHPEAHFACELQMEKIARELKIDPVEFRLKNILGPGKKNAIGQVMNENSGRFDLCVKKVAEEIFKEPREENKDLLIGRGIAAYMKTPIMPNNAQSGAVMKLNEDKSITLYVGAIEMGQGTYTALSQIAAEALNLPVEKIKIVKQVDTSFSPYEWQTVASHTTWGVGNAILIAAKDLSSKIKKAGSRVLKIPENEVDFNIDYVFSKINPSIKVELEKIASGYVDEKGSAITSPLIGEGSFVPSGLEFLDPETGQGNAAADWTCGCVGVEVEIDKNTGRYHIRKLVNAIDAGKIINPKIARDQVIGAMIQALGATISEVLIFSDKGKIRNNDLVDYKIPGIEDIPDEAKVIFIETPEETGPYGARGLGEHGAVAVSPAILNALYDALKISFNQIPVTPEQILKALEEVK
ncbi:xanthine dehydrogenase family protein molybdopterin-binding subunit [Thermovenabulum sp.]|uniref:xanthine dehydrogenase family protein molybdopterin-binding subunit n=1 Tax=Thermovenabulum sp. TaxID=3100335 RepID=UPI003C7E06A6